MKMISIIAILTAFLSITFSTSGQEFLPTTTNHQIVRHTYYTLSYSEKDEQAEWVYYELTAEMLKGKQQRTDDYCPDSLVSTISAQLEDYRGSGYDRGHLCPAGDMKINLTAMTESFLLSNCSPQDKDFNGGIWNDLENQVRQWAATTGKLYVVTAGVLKHNIGKIGSNGVTVPQSFYKVIYDPKGQRMIGFLIPNENSIKPLETFVVTVDYVEKVTGIDFFAELPNSLEKRLETSKDVAGWFSIK